MIWYKSKEIESHTASAGLSNSRKTSSIACSRLRTARVVESSSKSSTSLMLRFCFRRMDPGAASPLKRQASTAACGVPGASSSAT
eukprot:CAMPEP_0113819606 /NCGR_PEP_ID=MMETSP0328-20130328/823_1 /TAXON_ID=39455 /ORGANISM="Alexandrium minutum" /LENGTH=84 /DNA_ID=CAMNT_0000787539 /DNA_START=247 /DNA_END=501 /DNA_ORIENTATION=- /assembly_acc=CAM_ASM_000350